MRKTAEKLLLNRETLHRLNADMAELRAVAGGDGTLKTCGNPCSIACSNYTCVTTCARGICVM
jgi:hypothetical protein